MLYCSKSYCHTTIHLASWHVVKKTHMGYQKKCNGHVVIVTKIVLNRVYIAKHALHGGTVNARTFPLKLFAFLTLLKKTTSASYVDQVVNSLIITQRCSGFRR